jgi:hypothetical protein
MAALQVQMDQRAHMHTGYCSISNSTQTANFVRGIRTNEIFPTPPSMKSSAAVILSSETIKARRSRTAGKGDFTVKSSPAGTIVEIGLDGKMGPSIGRGTSLLRCFLFHPISICKLLITPLILGVAIPSLTHQTIPPKTFPLLTCVRDALLNGAKRRHQSQIASRIRGEGRRRNRRQ